MTNHRHHIRQNTLANEAANLRHLTSTAALSPTALARIHTRASEIVEDIRSQPRQGLMEVFLNEYGLSTDEGIALMTLAEALLRVPDSTTISALIDDKITPSNWGRHLGQSSSSLVNASTWALLLTGKVLDEKTPGLAGHLRGMLKRVGEPVIRAAVARAMREMGRQFVLGRDISEALKRAKIKQAEGFGYSYDMLGEAALTAADAATYLHSYHSAITTISAQSTASHPADNPGISVKLSALFPRYEYAQRQRVLAELTPRVLALAEAAASANMGFNIDAEEAARLDLSLDIIEAVLESDSLKGWDGFGVVVQAYSPRAPYVISWLNALAKRLDRRIMVRLVKGAYWDTEIKLAQVQGLAGFPVFTRKASTDISYIACARMLLEMAPRLYPQFATHNAHTVAAILEMAPKATRFEFQRLHGMGESLHDIVKQKYNTKCRIYAPVGAHRDLLAYLVRRLLENGANSSFVNQITNSEIPATQVATCPFAEAETYLSNPTNPATILPADLYHPARQNSAGADLDAPDTVSALLHGQQKFTNHLWHAAPLLAATSPSGPSIDINNPATGQQVGTCIEATPADVETSLTHAAPWQESSQTRAKILQKAAALFEANRDELMALATFEAGKTLADAQGELREAVDFIRYYASQAPALTSPARGVFTCISPWNFPLAIFTGQITAALAAGNAVLAKPAEATPLIAHRACQLLLEAGVPRSALQLLPGQGASIGASLTADPRISGVCFTGSTPTAKRIQQNMAKHIAADAPLIAETGGINAMIVDSSALPEQAVRDIIASAFQSAGQRCSALRVLYVQEDVADIVEPMIFGAMDELDIGNPALLKTDIGPLIDDAAQRKIDDYIKAATKAGRLLKTGPAPKGRFVAPTALRVAGMADVKEEIFGPVLHIARFKAEALNAVVDEINASGFGLTFGLHTRIDTRVQQVVERIKAGNIYINRNQIGAVVGSQPFGGEGLSGTGPKAGGPAYLKRFALPESTSDSALHGPIDLPGPTGESNRLSLHPRGMVLCLGPGEKACAAQQAEATKNGCTALVKDSLEPSEITLIKGINAVAYWGKTPQPYAKALAQRSGPILPLILQPNQPELYVTERHICIDTTASGGNAALLAQGAEG